MSNLPSLVDPAIDALLRAFFDARTRENLADLRKTLVAPSDGEDLGDDFVLYAGMVQAAAEEISAMLPDTRFERLAALEDLGPEPPPDAPDVGIYGATIIVKRGAEESEEGLMIYRFGGAFKIGLALGGGASEDGPPS